VVHQVTLPLQELTHFSVAVEGRLQVLLVQQAHQGYFSENQAPSATARFAHKVPNYLVRQYLFFFLLFQITLLTAPIKSFSNP